MSRDGVKRMDVSVRHRVSAEDVAVAIAKNWRVETEKIPRMSQAAIVRALKEVLSESGSNSIAFPDLNEEAEGDERYELALIRVKKWGLFA